jgi:hypothetical protein
MCGFDYGVSIDDFIKRVTMYDSMLTEVFSLNYKTGGDTDPVAALAAS